MVANDDMPWNNKHRMYDFILGLDDQRTANKSKTQCVLESGYEKCYPCKGRSVQKSKVHERQTQDSYVTPEVGVITSRFGCRISVTNRLLR